MSEHKHFIHLLRMPSDDRAILLLTFGLTVLVDLTVAIGVGVVLAALMFMNRMSKAVQIGTSQNGDDEEDEDEDEDEDTQRIALPNGVEVFRITGPFFFGVASELLDTLRRLGERPKVFILRLRLVPFLDTTGANALRDFVKECLEQGIQVIFSGTQPQPMRLLDAMGLGRGSVQLRHAQSYDKAITLALELRGQKMA
jgi:SulP family sulfate permease